MDEDFNIDMEDVKRLQDAALGAASTHIKKQRRLISNVKFVCVCLTIVLSVAIVCATVFGITAIQQQQSALIAQYQNLLDLMSGAEIVTETYTVETDGDSGIAIAGDNNNISGGGIENGD